jgi:HK97 family phage prohead protease
MRERRYATRPTEYRTSQRGTEFPYLVGFAAVFYVPSDLGTQFSLYEDPDDPAAGLLERLMPGCFDRALRERQDVRCLFNHDPNWVLGRIKSGTLKLEVTAKGLSYECQLNPLDQSHQMVLAKLQRGDVAESSFAFEIVKQKFVKQKGAPMVREVHDVDLFDVSAVTFPAYAATTASLRSAAPPERLPGHVLARVAELQRFVEGGL